MMTAHDGQLQDTCRTHAGMRCRTHAGISCMGFTLAGGVDSVQSCCCCVTTAHGGRCRTHAGIRCMLCSALLHRMDGQACVMAADFGQLQDTCRSMSFQPPKSNSTHCNCLQLMKSNSRASSNACWHRLAGYACVMTRTAAFYSAFASTQPVDSGSATEWW